MNSNLIQSTSWNPIVLWYEFCFSDGKVIHWEMVIPKTMVTSFINFSWVEGSRVIYLILSVKYVILAWWITVRKYWTSLFVNGILVSHDLLSFFPFSVHSVKNVVYVTLLNLKHSLPEYWPLQGNCAICMDTFQYDGSSLLGSCQTCFSVDVHYIFEDFLYLYLNKFSYKLSVILI